MMRSNPWFSFADHPSAARRAVDAAFVIYYFGLGLSGAMTFLGAPSPAVESVLANAGTWVWSVGTIVAAATALICRARRFYEAETVSLGVLAILTFLHGVMLLVGNDGMTGMQTGIRLIFACAMQFGVVIMLRHPTVRLPLRIVAERDGDTE